MTPTNGWNRYQKLVIYRLDEQDKKLDNLVGKVDRLMTSVTILKLKMGAIGAAAGTMGGLIVTGVYQWLFK